MARLLFALATAPTLAHAFTACALPQQVVAARVAKHAVMFDTPDTNELKFDQVTRSREANSGRTGKVAVTDGSGSFYSSRSIFQSLYDFGGYQSIVACSDATSDSKKMLLSRTARYSGLSDALGFAGSDDFAGADSWLALNPAEATLGAQVDAAVGAGVTRIFVLLTDALDAPEALEAKLAASGAEYTVMRTGPLVDAPSGSGLKLDELDMAVCDDVPKEDVFRFVTEALTLPEANGRAFSLCPSEGVASTLKQMRLAGYERRDEIQLLLTGAVREPDAPEEADLSAEEQAEQAELVLRSEAEVAAEREEELRMLLERARQRGVETQERLAFEEKERLAKREEMAKYYTAPPEDGDDGDAPADVPDAPPTE